MYGKMLEINLTTEETKEFMIDPSVIKSFIGGKGLGAYLLYKNLNGGEDPLSPENPLIFLTGPITGTGFPTSGRMVVVSKSPLTGTYTDSHVGGHFGNEMVKAGYHVIMVKGQCDRPKYLWINDGKIELRDAEHIYGNTVSKTVDMVREETDEKAKVACIGPAGESLSKLAAIMMDKDEDKTRAGIAGRTGVGAVMGSKNLKALAIKGTQKYEHINKDKMKEARQATLNVMKENEVLKVRYDMGSANLIAPMNERGYLPTRNFKQGFIDDGGKLSGEHMSTYKKRNATCYSCSINCGQVIKIENEEVKIEYESVALLGSNNGLKDIVDVSKACLLCNELGMDTMSAGVVVGFAMECKEKGLLDHAPEFGDAEGQLKLIEDMCYRRGALGELMADGVKAAAEKIGQGTEQFAIHVKGLEMAGYEPRTSWGQALAYATADRGACHQRCWAVKPEINGILKTFSFEDKPPYVKDVQDERAAAFSVLLCDFLPFHTEDMLQAISASTGIELSEKDYLKAGERIWNLIRLFNLREGFSRKEDTLPPRMFEDPLELPDGFFDRKEVVIPRDEFEKALDDYYALRGWDKNGVPSEEKIKELGLDVYMNEMKENKFIEKVM